MKIGIIQTKGIGDIIIALPIAAHFYRKGHEVVWPIDAKFYNAFKRVAPDITFVPVEPGNDADYYLQTPQKILQQHGCKTIHCLYHQLGTFKIANPGLAACLKFDEYKYAVAGVSFQEKWSLKLHRDLVREKNLFHSLNIKKPYICVHSVASGNHVVDFSLPASWHNDYQIIQVEERTSSVFDWIYTLEKAAKLVLIDSCMANLAEQMNLRNDKYFLLRSPVGFTPVMKNDWKFISPAHNFILPTKTKTG